MDSLEIQVDVNEAFHQRVTAGQPVDATLNAYPDWKIPGSVIAIIPTAGPQQGDGQGAHRDPVEGPRIVPDMGCGWGSSERRPPRRRRRSRRASSSPPMRCGATAPSS